MSEGGAFNRTNVELKFNLHLSKHRKVNTFNRTNVELKLNRHESALKVMRAFNRTNVELKSFFDSGRFPDMALLIVPMWN